MLWWLFVAIRWTPRWIKDFLNIQHRMRSASFHAWATYWFPFAYFKIPLVTGIDNFWFFVFFAAYWQPLESPLSILWREALFSILEQCCRPVWSKLLMWWVGSRRLENITGVLSGSRVPSTIPLSGGSSVIISLSYKFRRRDRKWRKGKCKQWLKSRKRTWGRCAFIWILCINQIITHWCCSSCHGAVITHLHSQKDKKGERLTFVNQFKHFHRHRLFEIHISRFGCHLCYVNKFMIIKSILLNIKAYFSFC